MRQPTSTRSDCSRSTTARSRRSWGASRCDRPLLRGLTYDGSPLHTTIDLALLLVGVVALVPASRGASTGVRWGWVASLVLVGALQVGVWFVGPVGVSLVWCALVGEAALRLRSVRGGHRVLLAAWVAVGAIAILAYAVTFPVVSTVAHVVAVLVGAGIGVVAMRLLDRRSTRVIGTR